MTPAVIVARVTRALEALRDEEIDHAERILDDLLWEFWNATKPPRRLDDSDELAHGPLDGKEG